jgi:hypothetical protein
MPSWKKVLVSGSSAQLNEVTASGGFSGDGSGLSGVTADTANIAVLEEGSSLTSQVSSLDFVGSSVTAAASGNAITVTISGTSGNALDDAWDRDDNDDIMPSTSNQVVDVHWALDSNNDIMPRVAQ